MRALSTRPGRAVTAAVVATAVVAVLQLLVHRPFGVRWTFDRFDLNVYFGSARWAVEGGTLYDDVPSEYPLLANLLFAAARLVGNLLSPGERAFYAVWMALAFLVYLYGLARVAQHASTLAVLVWLSPAMLYFSLYRYDVFPAVATLLALLAIRRGADVQGALWLGAAVALKGYALFLLPVFGVYLLHRRGLVSAIRVGSLTVIPMLASLVVVYLFAGWDGVTAPFDFHADRGLNNQSTYDAVNFLFGTELSFDGPVAQRTAQGLQVAAALLAAALRPRNFDELVNALLLVVLAFISLTVFYSPQFIVWVVPFACFVASRRMQVLALLFALTTYLYFPVSSDLTYYGNVAALRGSDLVDVSVAVVAIIRLVMIALAIYLGWRMLRTDEPTDDRPAVAART